MHIYSILNPLKLIKERQLLPKLNIPRIGNSLSYKNDYGKNKTA